VNGARDEREVVALGEVAARDRHAREALERRRDRLRVEPGGVDQPSRLQLVAAGEKHTPAAVGRRRAFDAAGQRERGAGALGVAEQRRHQPVAVDDARRGRQQRRAALEFRLECTRLGARQRNQFILETAVGRARAGRHRPRWQGANRSDGVRHREDSQRRQRGRGRLDRVRSGLTRQVRPVVSASRSGAPRFQRRRAVNCRF
jgi:hypothetical protein